MVENAQRTSPEVSGWAVGGITFAATMLLLIGLFQSKIGRAFV